MITEPYNSKNDQPNFAAAVEKVTKSQWSVSSKLRKTFEYWTIRYNKTRKSCTDDHRWALLYKVTSIRVWLLVEEGVSGASSLSRRWEREDEVCLSTIQRVLRKPCLTSSSRLEYILTRVCTAVHGRWVSAGLGRGKGKLPPEWSLLPDQDFIHR